MTLALQIVATVVVVWLSFLGGVVVGEDADDGKQGRTVGFYVGLPLVLVLLAIWRVF